MFELVIILLLLIAMFGSKQPYQFAMVMVVCAAVFARPIEMYGLYWAEMLVSVVPFLELGEEPEWIPFDLIFIMQSFLAGVLILSTYALREAKERFFFRAMAGFMLFNCFLIPAYRYDLIVTSEMYTVVYQVTAILQVMMVYFYSNGIKKLIRDIRGFVFRHYASISSIQRN